MKVSILGTEYDFYMCKTSDMDDRDNLGECDRYSKTIKINEEYFLKDGIDSSAMLKTIRHEVLHAVFHEVGLDCYAEDEVLVDAVAILLPKIVKTIEEVKR